MIWDGTPEELDKWLEDVFSNKKTNVAELFIDKIEG